MLWDSAGVVVWPRSDLFCTRSSSSWNGQGVISSDHEWEECMRLEKRIRALEARYIWKPVILYFADGSTRQLCGRSDFLLTLLADACRAGLSPGQAALLKLIRESVSAHEPSGGHMLELLRLCANGPLRPDQNDASL